MSKIAEILKAVNEMSDKDHPGGKKPTLRVVEGGAACGKVTLTPARLNRMRLRMNALGIDQTALAGLIGITPSSISLILAGKTHRTRHFAAIARALRVNLAWLLGDTEQQVDMLDLDGRPISEEMLPDLLRSEQFAQERTHIVGESETATRPEASGDMIALPEIDISCRSDRMVNDIAVKERPFFFSRDVLLTYCRTGSRQVMVLTGIGDAMQPTFTDTDLLLVDTGRRTLDVSDKSWVIRVGGAGAVKRLRSTPQGIRIMADNPAIGEDLVAAEDITIIGLVVGMLRKI